jgi:Bacterial archaeo-eukaryotic release factor family 2
MDLSYLRPLFDRPGPWASVYLDATRAGENADHEVDLRWRALREQLESEGADQATLDAVATAIQEHPYQPGRYGLAVFAAEGEAVLVETLSAPPPSDHATFDVLPHAMPLVAARGEEVPYVKVLSDRTGADVTGLDVGGVARHREVKGSESFPIRKVNAGGWSHRRYQQGAEETWKRNAGDVAAAVTELAKTVGAEVIVVGGDMRTNPLVAERLPLRWRERVVVTDAGTRHEDGEAHFDDVTLQAIAEVADRHAREAIDRYNAQRGDGTTGGGLADVVMRLQRGQADTVLLIDDPSSTDTLWISPDDPMLVAVDQFELRDSGINNPTEVRADEALLRAIVGTSAELVLVEPGEVELEHGIGAILRYADGDTAAS